MGVEGRGLQKSWAQNSRGVLGSRSFHTGPTLSIVHPTLRHSKLQQFIPSCGSLALDSTWKPSSKCSGPWLEQRREPDPLTHIGQHASCYTKALGCRDTAGRTEPWVPERNHGSRVAGESTAEAEGTAPEPGRNLFWSIKCSQRSLFIYYMEECEERTWDSGTASHHCHDYGGINTNNNGNTGRCSEVREQMEHPGKLTWFSWAGIWCIFVSTCMSDKHKMWGGRSRKGDSVDNLKGGVRVILTWAWC